MKNDSTVNIIKYIHYKNVPKYKKQYVIYNYNCKLIQTIIKFERNTFTITFEDFDGSIPNKTVIFFRILSSPPSLYPYKKVYPEVSL